MKTTSMDKTRQNHSPLIVSNVKINIPSRKSFNMLLSFNTLLETVDLGNEIGHLFVVDIDFNPEKANAKMLMDNDIYTPISE